MAKVIFSGIEDRESRVVNAESTSALDDGWGNHK
jgi:hypothetical protein